MRERERKKLNKSPELMDPHVGNSASLGEETNTGETGDKDALDGEEQATELDRSWLQSVRLARDLVCKTCERDKEEPDSTAERWCNVLCACL